jgi:hypothetical protein
MTFNASLNERTNDTDLHLSLKEWTNIRPGETKTNIFLSKKEGMYYLGKLFNLGIFEGIQVSPKSIKNKYVLIITWDYDKGGINLFLLDLNNKQILAKTNHHGVLGGYAPWVSWSPDENIALVSPGGEGVRELSYINVPSGTVRDVALRRFESMYKGNIKEMQLVDIENVAWKTNTMFSVPINLYCNPYDDDSCDGTSKPRRIIEANIDLKDAQNISYKEKRQ